MIELLPFTDEDIDRLVGWFPTPESLFVWTATTFEHPLTREQVKKFVDDSRQRGDRLFFKAVGPDGEVFGHIELGAIDRHHASLRIGRVVVDPALRGRGLAAGMMRAAVEKSFRELEMHRVELWVLEDNHSAIASYERVGFRREGVLRDVLKGPEGYRSGIVMSLLEQEWKQQKT